MNTYFKGDKAKYTGKKEVLYGKMCYEIILIEGHEKGKKKWTYFKPGEVPVN